MKLLFTSSLLLLLLLGAAALHPGAWGADVRPGRVDLRQSPSGARAAVLSVVGDQRVSGVCYSYSACTLMDYWRLSRTGARDSGTRCSPVEGATVASLRSSDHTLDGGQTCQVVEALTELGRFCSHEVLKNWNIQGLDLFFHRAAVTRIMTTFIQAGRPLPEVSEEGFRTRTGLTRDGRTYLEAFDLAWSATIRPELVRRGFAPAQIPAPAEVFLSMHRAGVRREWTTLGPGFLALLIRRECDRARAWTASPPVRCRSTGLNDTRVEAIIDRIRARLLTGAQPTAISYCANILTDNRYIGAVGGREDSTVVDCEHHASLIIGRRVERGQEQFLVRNSWGASCERYAWPCERGNVWISEQALRDNLLNAQWLEN